jgi:predicted adenylyl cyclase CyaB
VKETEREIEVKIKLENVSKIKKKLEDLGVSWKPPQTLIDKYYRPYGKERETQRPGSFIVRIRRANENSLAVKGLTGRKGVWEEYETKIGDAEAMEKILDKLGYNCVVTFHKKRTSTRYGDFGLEIDEIEELGNYLEAEAIGTEGKKLQEEIKGFFKKLDLPESNIERRGYPEIVMESQGVKFVGQK